MLEVENLSLSFGGLKAVSDLSFVVRQGSIFGLIGPNGAGKTSVLNCLCRLYTPTSGSVRFEGVELLKKPIHHLPRMGVCRTFQNLELFEDVTVFDNILIGCIHRYESGIVQSLLQLPSARRRQAQAHREAELLVEEFELNEVVDTNVKQLAFGFRKRVELARACASHPRLLLLDEPAAGLNLQESLSLGETIRKLQRDRNLTIVLVEHDMPLIMGVCDRIAVLVQGQKILEGSPKEVQSSPAVISAYLGEEMEHA